MVLPGGRDVTLLHTTATTLAGMTSESIMKRVHAQMCVPHRARRRPVGAAVAPELRKTEYAAYDRLPLGLAALQAHRPDGKALRRHRTACPWASTTADGRRY